MLRRIVERRWFIDDVRVVPWMSRRESVVPLRRWLAVWADPIQPNMEQFVERIPIRQPGGSFLFSAEEIASSIESECYRKANSCADRFAPTEIGRHFLNSSSL